MPKALEPSTPPDHPVAPWIVLVDRWKFMLGATFLSLLIAVGIALLWPKTYRTTATLLVTPPKYSEELVLPPAPLDMKTVETLANAYRTLQRVLSKVILQREMVGGVYAALSNEAGDRNPWERLRRLSPAKALEILKKDPDPLAEEAWNDLPAVEVLPGYLEFRDRDFEDLDPLVLAESLRTRILTELENRIRVEYQPILSLQAEWRTAKTSALFAHVWAKTFLRLLEEDYLSPTLAVQDKALDLVSRTELDLGQAYTDMASLEVESDQQVATRQRQAVLRQINETEGTRPSLRSQEERLLQEITLLEYRLGALDRWTRRQERQGLWVGFLGSTPLSQLQAEADRTREQRSRLAGLLNDLRPSVPAHGGDSFPQAEEKSVPTGSSDVAEEVEEGVAEKVAAAKSLLSNLGAPVAKLSASDSAESASREETSVLGVADVVEAGVETLSRWKALEKTLAARKDRLAALARSTTAATGASSLRPSSTEPSAAWMECLRDYRHKSAQWIELSEDLSQRRAKLSAVQRQTALLSAQEAELKQKAAPIQSRLEDQARRIRGLEEQFAYVLGEAGGAEAMGEDYPLMARVHLLEEPVPPKRRLRPQRSVMVLGMGFGAFLFLCGWVVVSDQYRRIRNAQPF